MRDLTRDLGIGTCCGKCVPEAKVALHASLHTRKDSREADFFTHKDAEFAA
jgi:bacterioferritin-associated ferredoxin